ncbi:MAG TPA: aminopeptidase [Thermoanaerobaculia bacterium]|nr:aminopeptidase [Thermoanaerobaculia bacterium]
MRCIRRHPFRSAGALLALSLLLTLGISAEARFLLQAGWTEARILLGRQPIHELIADPATSPERQAQLELVLAARSFAARQLGLRAGNTYTTFSDVGEGPLLHVLSASRQDRLEAYRWTYPVVGSIPYKGFFDEQAALAEKRRLERAGYDTYLRQASAFSTLGWFSDPLLSTALGDPADLASTVIHEISHNTLWVPSAARFNESYANFVGLRGAEAFFLSRGDRQAADRCAALWRDEKRLGAFYTELAERLESLYAEDLPARERERRRADLFARARAVMMGPLDRSLEVYSGKAMSRRGLNNAVVVAQRIYRTGLEDFDQIHAASGEDLRSSVSEIRRTVHLARLSRVDDPFRALAAKVQLVSRSGKGGGRLPAGGAVPARKG